jgi:hypothetical protein
MSNYSPNLSGIPNSFLWRGDASPFAKAVRREKRREADELLDRDVNFQVKYLVDCGWTPENIEKVLRKKTGRDIRRIVVETQVVHETMSELWEDLGNPSGGARDLTRTGDVLDACEAHGVELDSIEACSLGPEFTDVYCNDKRIAQESTKDWSEL